ncbi:Lsr2 family protein [Streptomyces sp. NPDC086783]|uniref:histone-like nucleoid-structuring protein Lsr2 n=1 Tax=Streptomyces sp. NPDC086783 TaxID=3365758 RepID=UPI00380274FF
MAQKVIRTFVDDLTGEQSKHISTHSILIDGAGVEIDLTDENYETLLEQLNPYLHADGARRIRGARVSKKARSASVGQEEVSAIRAWARTNGYEVNDRGRVPAAVREAYEQTR